MKKSKKAYYSNNGEKFYKLYNENGEEIGRINPIYEMTQNNHVKVITIFVLTKDGKLILEKRTKDTQITPGAIDLVSGHVDSDEKRKKTVYRELKEETGIKKKNITKPKKIKGNISLNISGRKFLVSVYVTQLKKKKKKFNLQEEEVEDIMIVPMQEGFDLIRKGLTRFPYAGNEEIFEEVFEMVELYYQKTLEKQNKKKQIKEYSR